MGTKRVGWARIRSLINENANQLGPRYAHVRSALTGDTTLTAADYGKVILLDGSSAANFTISLPTDPTVGAELTFCLATNNNGASQVVVDSGVNNKIEGFAIALLASSNTTAYHTHKILGFDDAAKRGSMMHIVCVDATAGARRWLLLDSKCDIAFINAIA
tara:strand:+ start:1647 stop:2129 length:483 start_codon:yes stop_codon:yes gene_type:complete